MVHALRDCRWAKEVWEFIIAPTQWLNFLHMDPERWIKDNITLKKFDNIILPSLPWVTIFVATTWCIWKARNKFIFQNARESKEQTIFFAKRLVEDLSRISSTRNQKEKGIGGSFKWRKPEKGWHKMNMDGSVLTTRKSAAAGGLLRNESGDWIGGFTYRLGDVSITMAKLIAAREGLKLAWERRVPKLELEIDSEVVVKLIKSADTSCHPLGRLIEDCRVLLRMPWESRIVHTKRSGNDCADALAKLGHELEDTKHFWEEAPQELLLLLEEDLI